MPVPDYLEAVLHVDLVPCMLLCTSTIPRMLYICTWYPCRMLCTSTIPRMVYIWIWYPTCGCTLVGYLYCCDYLYRIPRMRSCTRTTPRMVYICIWYPTCCCTHLLDTSHAVHHVCCYLACCSYGCRIPRMLLPRPAWYLKCCKPTCFNCYPPLKWLDWEEEGEDGEYD